jgi:hypothetical protein
MDLNMTVFFQHTLFAETLGLDDVACLKCVCKGWFTELEHLYKDKEEDLSKITAISFGNKKHEVYTEHLLNLPVFVKSIKQFQIASRNVDRPNGRAHIVQTTKEFTLRIAKTMIKDVKETSSLSQKSTFVLLLNLFENTKNSEIRILVVYIMFYYMNKLVKRNSKEFVKQGDCILSSRRFRKVILKKCDELISHMRDEVTCFPYSFMNKVIRVCGETKRLISDI